MGALGVFQIFIDIAFGVGLFFITMRITRQPKDDPRLSRGLQLLQSKISVLEDLSDRTETQVNQLITLLEQKIRDVQNKIELADKHVQYIRESMDRSLEVAKIFQDKIPHQEIIERQNTKKYLKAARLAHQGKSVEEIAQAVDLPRGELEFIAKVNREQLMFSEDQLPDWAREEDTQAAPQPANPEDNARLAHLANQQSLIENLQQVQTELDQMLQTESVTRDFSGAFNVPAVPTNNLNKLGEEFRKACVDVEAEAQPKFAASDKLTFVELTPPQEPVITDFEEEAPQRSPLLDLSAEEIAQIKATAEAIPQQVSQAAKVLAQQAASIFKTAAQVEGKPAAQPAPTRTQATAGQQARAQAAMSAVAQANAQAKAQMQPEPKKADPRAQALAQARAQANELRKPQPRSTVNQSAEVRKVEFPRIKSTDNLG